MASRRLPPGGCIRKAAKEKRVTARRKEGTNNPNRLPVKRQRGWMIRAQHAHKGEGYLFALDPLFPLRPGNGKGRKCPPLDPSGTGMQKTFEDNSCVPEAAALLVEQDNFSLDEAGRFIQ